ncbi:hypothetical protein Nepgr_032107 [Nepenthes gracilis]|uniref:Phytocyanin domain-containing protein n=1 Tax=Nepenthes gracilis TaxID=150966 RepID=A0AAD3TJC7_NEPGR|nr:hypothetical protein Nepgr_032107 [Nepenthes gracilis]
MKKILLLSMVVLCVLSSYSPSFRWRLAEAQVHHVVGDDRGWDESCDIASWSAGRVFRVGDFIWFTYSAAVEKIVELKSKEEFESCDSSNPIGMYTDGLDKVLLDREGIRYFASGNPESCKKGLKLPVHVMPNSTVEIEVLPSAIKAVSVAGPVSPPSDSTLVRGPTVLLFSGLSFLYYLAL